MGDAKIVLTANDHIKVVAQNAATVDRLEAEIEVMKANLKLAKTTFNLSVRGLQTYADEQLAFDL